MSSSGEFIPFSNRSLIGVRINLDSTLATSLETSCDTTAVERKRSVLYLYFQFVDSHQSYAAASFPLGISLPYSLVCLLYLSPTLRPPLLLPFAGNPRLRRLLPKLQIRVRGGREISQHPISSLSAPVLTAAFSRRSARWYCALYSVPTWPERPRAASSRAVSSFG